MSGRRVMILAGEASGDAHAAAFVKQLRELDPDVTCSGMGGTSMREAGVDVFFDSSIIAVVGLVEVLRHWGDIKRAMEIVKSRLESEKPDLLVLVDYPEFNLKMARHARSLGIRVLFYISPQVWAWRPKRIHKIGRLIDHMAVIFKFEKRYYEAAGIPVSFVGHPLVDEVNRDIDAGAVRRRLGIPAGQTLVGLFPGSRRSEILRLLPVMLQTAQLMHQQRPELGFLLPVASTLNYDEIAAQCADANLGAAIQVVQDDIDDLISVCDAIATCSGTVTLEIALLNKPMCIVYRMSSLSYFIMSRLVTIPHIGLANIVADDAVVRELLQDNANPEAIAAELTKIIDDNDYRMKIKSGLERVRKNLGSGNGARNVAELVISLLDNKSGGNS